MTNKTPRSRSRGLKTWSAFGNLGRRPTEYEVLTHNMNHTTGPCHSKWDRTFTETCGCASTVTR